jgi:hypothetical protein
MFTVPFDPPQLGVTPYVNTAQTFGRHLTLLDAEPAQQMVDPFEAEDAGVRTTCTRTAMFVPFKLKSGLLGQDYTAEEAFRISLPFSKRKNWMPPVSPSLNFCR